MLENKNRSSLLSLTFFLTSSNFSYNLSCFITIVKYYLIALCLSQKHQMRKTTRNNCPLHYQNETLHVIWKKHVKQVSWKVSGILFPVQELCLNYWEKIVQIQNYFWSVFSHIWAEYGEIRIQSECGKIWTRNNSVFGHFSRSE